MGLCENPIRKNTQRRSAWERSAKYHNARPQINDAPAAAARNTVSIIGLGIALCPPGHLEQDYVLQDMSHDGKPDALATQQVKRAVNATRHRFRSYRKSAGVEVIDSVSKRTDCQGRQRVKTEGQHRAQPDHAVKDLFSRGNQRQQEMLDE